MYLDIGELSDSASEEEAISINDKDEVWLNEQSNSEQSENELESDCQLNPAPKCQKSNSENVSSCSSSTSKPIPRVTRAHSKPETSRNNEDNMKENLELQEMLLIPLIQSQNIFQILMMTSLLKNCCEKTNVVDKKYNHQQLLANMLKMLSVCHQTISIIYYLTIYFHSFGQMK